MKRLSLLALVLAGCAHMSQPLAPSRHYAMKLGANNAGGMTVTTNGGTSVVDFEFNDRGRGPKTHSVYTLDADGLPIDLTTHEKATWPPCQLRGAAYCRRKPGHPIMACCTA